MDQKNSKIPEKRDELFLPLEFWLDAIAYLDKRVEIIANSNDGFGILEMHLKVREGKIYELEFEEKVSHRDIVRKANNLMHESVNLKKKIPAM